MHGICVLFVWNGNNSMPSTVIASFEYNEPSQQLVITFKSGLVYRYKKVPKEIYLDMKAYREKGIYFNKNIKGKFEFEKSNNL